MWYVYHSQSWLALFLCNWEVSDGLGARGGSWHVMTSSGEDIPKSLAKKPAVPRMWGLSQPYHMGLLEKIWKTDFLFGSIC